MISTVPEFDDATAFERLAIAYVPVRATTSGSQPILELLEGGGAHHTRVIVDSLGGNTAASVIDRLRPLLFGAAWKVLDLLIELALAQAGYPPPKTGRVTITEKATQAGSGHCPPR